LADVSDPFATPAEARSPARRFRGRLPSAVTLWTANDVDGRPAGLTMSSTVVVEGQPARVLGILDEESSLWETVRAAGRFVVTPLRKSDGQLADMFAGLMPAPGGPFVGLQWLATEYGPLLPGTAGWVGCRLDDARPMGWGLLVEATIERVEIALECPEPLIHYRGRYETRLG
jgi:flavin reductase (DIM6/NTAB) family NADH-FMN oxidoreductase RutF